MATRAACDVLGCPAAPNGKSVEARAAARQGGGVRFPDDVPTLTAGDVTLRAHRPDDGPAVVEQCVDPDSLRWTTVPVGYTIDMAADFVGRMIPEGWESGRDLAFALESPHPDGVRRFSGTLSLRDGGDRRAEIAFGAHPAVRGRGVMSTAVDLLLDWGFAERGLETVLWQANAGNVASRRVAWRAGFTFGGTLRRWLPQRGDYLDAWTGALHRDDSREPKTRWLQPVPLDGDGVRLRALSETDEERYLETVNDPVSQRWLGTIPMPRTPEQFAAWQVRRAVAASMDGAVEWTVAAADDDRYLGTFVVFGFDALDYRSAEIGYRVHPAERGRGVATAALRALVRHCFAAESDGGLGLQRVSLGAAATNTASQQVALASGFTRTGVDRRCYETQGDGIVDLVRFDLLCDEVTGLAP